MTTPTSTTPQLLARLTSSLASLEAHRDSLSRELRRKDAVLARLRGGSLELDRAAGTGGGGVEDEDEYEDGEEDMEVEEEEEEEVAPDEDTVAALAAEEAGDYAAALARHAAAASRALEETRDLHALVCCVRFAVRNALDELMVNEELAGLVAEAFDVLVEVAPPEMLDEVRQERAVFLARVDNDPDEAKAEFQRALQVMPDDPNLLYTYANFLSMWESESEGASASGESSRESVETLYRRALAVEPSLVPALNNLGALLVEKSRPLARGDAARAAVLREAVGLFERAEALAPGAPAYNAACAFALLGEPERAKTALTTALTGGNLDLSAADVQADPDLESVRGLPWFAQLLRKL